MGKLTLHEALPWRLFATYFGLCFVGVASGVYQWRCPTEVKRYASGSDYVAGVVPYISDIEETRVRQAIVGDAESKAELERLTSIGYDFGGAKNDEEMERRVKRVQRDILQLHFDLCNRSFPVSRFIVGGCYLLGGLILIVPSIDIFLRVLRVLAQAMGLGAS